MIGRPVGTGSAVIALTALALARLMRRWRRSHLGVPARELRLSDFRAVRRRD